MSDEFDLAIRAAVDDAARDDDATWLGRGSSGPSVPLVKLPRPPGPSAAQFGRFRAERQLGAGGMGVVWLAHDDELRREVAIKVLSPRLADNPHALARFVAEAQITAQLDHPNIVPVHDLGTTASGELYIVMKLARGETLDSVLQSDTAWSRPRLLRAFLAACHGVQCAHEHGVLHRDLKPANIMLGRRGEVLVLDWGIAALRGGLSTVRRETSVSTEEGSVLGTPGYMAPEQSLGNSALLSPRSDVWSLGAILYVILTGRRPYIGRDVLRLLALAKRAPPMDPRLRAPDRDIPEDLALLTLECLDPAPDRRPADAGELADRLNDHFDGVGAREDAAGHLARARVAMDEARSLEASALEHMARLDRAQQRVPAHAPQEDRAELWSLRRTLATLDNQLARARGRAIASANQAVVASPSSHEARDLMARLHFDALIRAESAGDTPEASVQHDLVHMWGGADWADRLRGDGTITLKSAPAGARVTAQRWRTDRLVWELEPPVALGVTPLANVTLARGSWVLTLRLAGHSTVVYPVRIDRAGHWDGGAPVLLPPPHAVPSDCIFVPHGPFLCGGDEGLLDSLPAGEPTVESFVISRHHVTCEEYCAFLNTLPLDEALARSPRFPTVGRESFWGPPPAGTRWTTPQADLQGNYWDPQWPIGSISAEDAEAYAAWRAAESGIPYRLPTELEWEKAARGVDGRPWPWGDAFDATLACTRESRPGRPMPSPVGEFASDVSVYGMRDVSGNVRTWCAETRESSGEEPLQVARGGYYQSTAQFARVTRRAWASRTLPNSYCGVRVAASWPPPPELP